MEFDNMSLEEKLHRMAEIKAEIDKRTWDLQKELVLLEDNIKEEVLVNNTPFEDDTVRVSIRHPVPKNQWDNKGLMGYSVIYPDILKFCTT